MENEWEQYSFANDNVVKYNVEIDKLRIKDKDNNLLLDLTSGEVKYLANLLSSEDTHIVGAEHIGAVFVDDEDAEISQILSYLELEDSTKQFIVVDNQGMGVYGREIKLFPVNDGENIKDSLTLNEEDMEAISEIIVSKL